VRMEGLLRFVKRSEQKALDRYFENAHVDKESH